MDTPQVIVTVDLGFGDAGKGSVIDYLSQPGSDVAGVVRYSGGAQAAHRVVQPDGREHVFSQFGAGSFHDGVRTYLGPRVLVNPLNLLRENDHLREVGVDDALSRLSIDSRCVLVTPFHVAANRIRELLRGDGRHGSCGQGIGEARADDFADRLGTIRVGDVIGSETRLRVSDGSLLFRKLVELQARKHEEIYDLISTADHVPAGVAEEFRVLGDFSVCAPLTDACMETLRPLAVLGAWQLGRLLERGRVVFEGAQGVLIDQSHGFQPYTTWTDTTSRPALELLAEVGYDGPVRRLGIVRAYQTRHGPGPFPTEDEYLTATLPDVANGDDAWQGGFRVGWLDLPLLRYAIAANGGVDALAVTCLDRVLDDGWFACPSYRNTNTHPFVAFPGCDPAEHGRRLALLLERAEPILWPLEPTFDGYMAALKAATDAPVVLTSYGPTRDDKKVVVGLRPELLASRP